MLESDVSAAERIYGQGIRICRSDRDFEDGLRAAVDYRGDVTVELTDGSTVEGFLFNKSSDALDLFPKDSPRKLSVNLSELACVEFSGRDEAAGKSWEEWVKKREALKQTSPS